MHRAGRGLLEQAQCPATTPATQCGPSPNSHIPSGTSRDAQGTRTSLLQFSPHHRLLLRLQTGWGTTTAGIRARTAERRVTVATSLDDLVAQALRFAKGRD